MPLEDDPNNNESDSVNHESEEEPAWAKERLPRKEMFSGEKAIGFTFMPQHANQEGNQAPNAGAGQGRSTSTSTTAAATKCW